MEVIVHYLAGAWQSVVDLFTMDTSHLGDWDMIARLILQAVLFSLSAFFSGSETALFSLSRLDLQKLRRERHAQSDNLHDLLDHPRRLIISILCGNELVNIAATANLAGIMVALYGPERAALINIIVMLPLVLLIGEVTPKTIAVSNPMRVSAGLVAGPMTAWVRMIMPLRRAIRVIADRVTTWIVGEERTRENLLGADEFRLVLDEVTKEGVLDGTERVLIDNLLEAGEVEIVEIMTPRTRMQFISDDMTVPEMVEIMRRHRRSRIPVCHLQRDNLVGFVHAEDVMRYILDGTDLSGLSLADLMHPPVVVPPTKNVDEMFDFFQRTNTRAAVVINEFGGVDGMITMRDVINNIFGEVAEEVAGQELYQEQDQDVYEVDGLMKLTDFNDLSTFNIQDRRMTTVGGVVFRFLDRLPQVGDRAVLEDGIVATVLEMDGHRLAKVRLERSVEPEESAPAPPVPADDPFGEQSPSPEGFEAEEPGARTAADTTEPETLPPSGADAETREAAR